MFYYWNNPLQDPSKFVAFEHLPLLFLPKTWTNDIVYLHKIHWSLMSLWYGVIQNRIALTDADLNILLFRKWSSLFRIYDNILKIGRFSDPSFLVNQLLQSDQRHFKVVTGRDAELISSPFLFNKSAVVGKFKRKNTLTIFKTSYQLKHAIKEWSNLL